MTFADRWMLHLPGPLRRTECEGTFWEQCVLCWVNRFLYTTALLKLGLLVLLMAAFGLADLLGFKP